MRRHCLEIFHYVADQLKDTPLFESTNSDNLGPKVGAVFNDFEFHTPISEEDEPISSQYECAVSSCGPSNQVTDLCDLVPQSLVDHAIVRADETVSINYSQSVINSPSFDIENEIDSDDYLKNVYYVLLREYNEVDFNNETLQLFESRRRMNWNGKDSFYDAWLIAQLTPRSVFPFKEFKEKYPELFEEKPDVTSSPSPKRFKPSREVDEVIVISSSEEEDENEWKSKIKF